MAPEAQVLINIIVRIIDQRRSETSISPSWVATEAMLELDPKKVAPMLVQLGCHLELRQIARSVLRDLFEDGGKASDDDDEGSRQHALFPDLQWRYPKVRTAGKNEEPVYVRLEELSAADIAFNVSRLRSEALAKLAHADALERYGRVVRKKGGPHAAPHPAAAP
ncbi:hypothetical protein HU675_0045390 [Bradyrhizobium septentrionale]|uniref:hypothetical protein n=1 Tax=Bradyrhizobium septentrionale TaxID=1404411 RepID=UPI001CD532A6|nr:hypothetical protein [Bradyrhizobium septentrionale]UGY21494.1 hypothetical protein HU675_0026060 [Bradyrhizobium septentrionale]UGY25027.1 hypothetical protein HU675_0045390 [Bradyrhizobium septentrionale]